ncbi:hypothetical protein GW17_00039535, partial [Ensete ventricosum]
WFRFGLASRLRISIITFQLPFSVNPFLLRVIAPLVDLPGERFPTVRYGLFASSFLGVGFHRSYAADRSVDPLGFPVLVPYPRDLFVLLTPLALAFASFAG